MEHINIFEREWERAPKGFPPLTSQVNLISGLSGLSGLSGVAGGSAGPPSPGGLLLESAASSWLLLETSGFLLLEV